MFSASPMVTAHIPTIPESGRLLRPQDPSRLPPEKQSKWIFTAPTWSAMSDDQKRRWREWFAWAISPGGELWDDARNVPNLPGARLDDADLPEVHLAGADLRGASLRGTCLSRADLTGATLHRAHLENAALDHASLQGADLGGAHLAGVDFTGADLSESLMHQIDMTGVNLRNARLYGARISEPVWWLNAPRVTLDGRTQFPADLPEHPIQDVLGVPPLLRRAIADAQYLRDMYRKARPLGRAVMWIWGLTCCFGQSLVRWSLVTLGLLLAFSLIYTLVPFNFWIASVDHGAATASVHRPDFFQGLYFSISTMMTLGLGDVVPASGTARIVVSVEEVFGYLMLGGLLSIFSNKLARLS